ncbi:MAG: V-type ATP synthase subunit A [Betaproteobacteria bacterium]|nr:V-type ATP synthase subunit A [Betaproteobacteria bacterium]
MSHARVRWISGPVLRAAAQGPFSLREAVHVGPQALLGEVVRLAGDEITVQVYEDTTGLGPGTEVRGTGQPLAIRLGPGLLGNIFDGLLRPLTASGSVYVQPGARTAARTEYGFTPLVVLGQTLEPGTVFGEATTDSGRKLRCLLPPDADGEVIRISAPGRYADDAPVLELRLPVGEPRPIAMSHVWPVRVPRPVRRRLAATRPLVTGQRILDSLFPLAQGGKAAIPGGFGTGKTVLLETLAKGCDADVIVYLGCGERGNEMAGVLDEFPRLTDPRSARPLMERTVVIANTSNMPVAAREASIYSAITVAEYFRDQGLHVALMADSTSRWAEALREVSGRFGELPGEGGYPAYLSSRLAEFYERAAVVETLGGETGSVTVMGAISPPSGDFSEPVTSHTKRYVRAFWALDVKRAQARFYPAIHPLQSYAEDAGALAAWWRQQGNSRWPELRRQFLTLLDDQARLERMARIIGKDALPVRQQLTLFCAELVNEAFLRQSALSTIDHRAGPERQAAMMRTVGRFIELAEQAVAAGTHPERMSELPCLRAVQRMGEDIDEENLPRFAELSARMEHEFGQLSSQLSDPPSSQPDADPGGQAGAAPTHPTETPHAPPTAG